MKSHIIKSRFENEISGFHILHSTPIKENVWEELNRNIVEGICSVHYNKIGNHVSGKDNTFDMWTISNKTAKIQKNMVNISSYRLTNTCSEKRIACEKDIINEVEKRDESFDYYSILIRKEDNTTITYSWYIIPKSYYVFKIQSGSLKPKYGKRNHNKDTIIGWESKFCNIVFSMSSQLWYKFDIELIEKYKIHSVKIVNNNTKLKYAELYTLIKQQNIN